MTRQKLHDTYLGLIDALGSESQAIAALKERAHIATDIKWVHPPCTTGLWALMSAEGDECKTLFSTCINEVCTILENRYNPQTLH